MSKWLEDNATVCTDADLTLARTKAIVSFVRTHGEGAAVRLIELRRNERAEFAVLDIDVDRPQVRKVEIQATERIAIAAEQGDQFLSILALRDDFPSTLHQNAVFDEFPASLCIDDRPWQEAKLSWTPAEAIGRIRLWLAKAVKGELNDPGQPLEPYFYASNYSIVLPRTILDKLDSGEVTNIIASLRTLNGQDKNPTVLLPKRPLTHHDGALKVSILSFALPDQMMEGIHRLPSNVAQLCAMTKELGFDLMKELRSRIQKSANWNDGDFYFLESKPAICLVTKVKDPASDRVIFDSKAFLSSQTAGELGVAIGALAHGTDGTRYVPAIPMDETLDGDWVKLDPLNVYSDFDRLLANEISGAASLDNRQITMIGAGAIGSHIASAFAREGAFRWDIVDEDYLLPHNLSRHALGREFLGVAKSLALAQHLRYLLADETAASGLIADCLQPGEDAEALAAMYQRSELILDTSASIAVSRHLGDLPDVKARMMSAFFNPTGTAAILLVEPSDRSITLREVEAHYYREILTTPELADHLDPGPRGVQYSGSCRTLTNRIPERSAAILSALAGGGIKRAFDAAEGGVWVWTLANDGGVKVHHSPIATPTVRRIGDWKVTVDASVLADLQEERQRHLPNETGGILLGIVDHQSKAVTVVHALYAPPDSEQTVTGFERGIEGLQETIRQNCSKVMDQVRYVGEWHSHPAGSSSAPSLTDLEQIVWLSSSLHSDGQPAVMLIVGEDEETIPLALAL